MSSEFRDDLPQEGRLRGRRPFKFSRIRLYGWVPASAGYGDKVLRSIGTTDPGAVPGGSTKTGSLEPVLMGPNQDRRVLKSAVFARAE